MTEGGRVFVDVGDRPAVGLEADAGQRGVPRVAVQQRRDDAVGQVGQVVPLPVAPVGVALDAVVASLERQVGELAHRLAVWHADRTQRGEE